CTTNPTTHGTCPSPVAKKKKCKKKKKGHHSAEIAKKKCKKHKQHRPYRRHSPAATGFRPGCSGINDWVSDQRHPGGLSSQEAAKRLRKLGPIEDRTSRSV